MLAFGNLALVNCDCAIARYLSVVGQCSWLNRRRLWRHCNIEGRRSLRCSLRSSSNFRLLRRRRSTAILSQLCLLFGQVRVHRDALFSYVIWAELALLLPTRAHPNVVRQLVLQADLSAASRCGIRTDHRSIFARLRCLGLIVVVAQAEHLGWIWCC